MRIKLGAFCRLAAVSRRLRSPSDCSEGDLPLPGVFKGAILVCANDGESGECRSM
jgi:hypothetical protein